MGSRNRLTPGHGSEDFASSPRNAPLSATPRGFDSFPQSPGWAASCFPTRFIGQLPATTSIDQSTFGATLLKLEVALTVLLVYQ